MQRILAFLVIVVMIITTSIPAFGQASRYRVPTKADQNEQPTPSFRGSERQHYDRMPQQGYGLGAQPGLPSTGAVTGEAGIVQMALGYQVHVLGEVISPGTYRIPASGRLADAIQIAGGLADNGSERRIELKRKGRRVQLVDLLKFRLNGSLANNPYLMDNDVIHVPLRKSVIQVVGAVRRPEIYELRGEDNLSEVVDLAGGFNAATATEEPIRIIRYVGGEKRVEEVPINKGDMKRFRILNGDVVVVPNVVTKETKFDYNVAAIPGDQVFYPSYEDRVFVLGGVQFPGAYPFSPYYTVNQYISLAGGIGERGKENYRIIDASGKSRKANENDRVNPGDTIMIKQRWMTPAGWAAFLLGVASFGLSASATIIAITR